MDRFGWLLRKSKTVVRKGPSTLRNLLYSRLGIWRVDRIDGCDLQGIPIYCISLAAAKRRRRLVERQVRDLGLEHFEFVEAVEASALDREQLRRSGQLDDETTLRFHSRLLTMNEVACSISHGIAYSRIVERKHPVALVIEDDALFISRRARRFRLADVPADFDCVFLNAFLFEEPPRGHLTGTIYRDTSYSGSSAAYLLSARGAEKLAAACRPVIHAADGLLGRSLELAEGQSHPFRQRGATMSMRGYIVHPDCVLNGSTSYYHVSEVQTRRGR